MDNSFKEKYYAAPNFIFSKQALFRTNRFGNMNLCFGLFFWKPGGTTNYTANAKVVFLTTFCRDPVPAVFITSDVTQVHLTEPVEHI